MNCYSKIEYPRNETGVDDYPQRLVDYLLHRFFRHVVRVHVLDIGCGKGDYVNAFNRRGMLAKGVDVDTPLTQCDFEKDPLPFKSNMFGLVFSKSTLEHILNSQHLLA